MLRKNGKLVSNKPSREDPRFPMTSIEGKGAHLVRLRFSDESQTVFVPQAFGSFTPESARTARKENLVTSSSFH